MRGRVPWLRVGAIVGAAVVIMILAAPTWAAGGTDTGAKTAAAEKKALPEGCALLDDPDKLALMDGLLLKLTILCDRTDLLGQVRQEPNMDVGWEVGSDVRANDPAGDTSGHSTQSETSIAVNETTGTICSGYNDSGTGASGSYSGFSRSTDGGATFTDRASLTSGSYGDPSMVWRKSDGNFYYATLGSSSLRVYRSTDDCQTFTQAGTMGAGGSDDKELMAVDNNPASSYYGRLYVVWTNFGVDSKIWATYSTTGGASWTGNQAISASSSVQGAWPAVGPNGYVYVGWVEFGSGTISIRVSRTTDGGATWAAVTSPATSKVQPQDSTATGNCGRAALKGNIRYLPSPELAVGPDGALHVVYSYDPDSAGSGDTVNVYYRKSTDGGSTWGTEVLLNDDGTTRDQFFPTVSVGSSNVVSATWYDRRLDPNNTLLDYYQRFSFDGGTTWQPSVRVSDVSSPIYIDPNLNTCYHGDYDTQVQTATTNLIQWADDRATQFSHNDPDVWFDTQPVSTNFLVNTNPHSQSVCAPDNAVYSLDVQQFMGFTEPVTLAASNVPTNATTGFSANPVIPPGTSQLTIGNTAAVAAGSYTVTVTGTSSPSSFVHDTSMVLDLYTQAAGALTPTAPLDGAVNQQLRPVFTWTAATQAATNRLQVATDPGFGTVVLDVAGISGQTYTPTSDLSSNFHYYWRVWATNACGDGPYSAVFDFYTVALPGDCGMGTVPSTALSENFESGVGGWTHMANPQSSYTVDTWALQSAQVHGGSYAFHADDWTTYSDQLLISPSVVLPASGSALTLQFWNYQDLEPNTYSNSCYDGGIVEISTNGGTTWTYLPTTVMLTDPYDGPVSGIPTNPYGWCGRPQDWLNSVVDIAAYAGQTAKFRFRLGTDVSLGYTGWTIDDVKIQTCVESGAIFSDGFEAGTTSAWSNPVP